MAAFPSSDAISVLAFDFGTHKIGVAIGQSLTQSAKALPELKARDGQPNWDEIAALLEEWQPDAFVVGIPINMDGSEFELTHRARKFGKRLHGRFGKPCFEMDERLSSFDARDHVRSEHGSSKHGHPGKQKHTLVDSVAASLILQSWFNDQWPDIKNKNN